MILFSFEVLMDPKKQSGDNGEEGTPVPIPNTVVKLLSVDGTWRETARESRSLPDLFVPQ